MSSWRPMLLPLALGLLATHAAGEMKQLTPAADGIYRFGKCYAQLKGDLLTLGNGEIERKWAVADAGLLRAVSFRDLQSGTEWIKGTQPGTPAAGPVHLAAATGQGSVTEEPSLLLTLSSTQDTWTVETRLQIFEAARGVLIDRQLRFVGASPTNPPAPSLDLKLVNTLESLALAPESWTLTRLKFLDSTDSKPGPLVIEYPGGLDPQSAGKDPDARVSTNALSLKGNVFHIENDQTGEGLLLVKHAPLPGARPAAPGKRRGESFDVVTVKGRVDLLANEITDVGGRTYRCVVLAYQGGRAGRIAALQVYYRQLRKYEPTRDGLFLSNTWGGQHTLNDTTVKAEIDAGARLGVDVVQVDDGWQQGKGDGRDASKDPAFWTPNAKNFPNGLKPHSDYAKAKGMQFGIWFSPNYTLEFKDWEKDRDILLALHREAGVNYFKVDKFGLPSRVAEANLGKLVSSVIEGSQGRAVIDLDVTLGARPGYFGIPNHGPLFVENRYSRAANFALPAKEAANAYWPHRTLRNFWLLAQYVDPIRLRMEFLNNERDQKNYGDSPLAPIQYPPDTLFASVMFGSPLGWFGVASLPASYFERVAPLVATWKVHRQAIVNGSVIPVGAMPDGAVWTGFVSTAQDRQSAYALVFRELNESPSWSVAIPLLAPGATSAQVLAGDGQASLKDNTLNVALPAERTYLLVRIAR